MFRIINWRENARLKQERKKAEQEARERHRRAKLEKERTQQSKKEGRLGRYLKF
jgi:hypothetical protein